MNYLAHLGAAASLLVASSLAGAVGAHTASASSGPAPTTATTTDLTVNDLTTTGNVLFSGVTSNPASVQLTATNNSNVASPGSMYGILESNVFSPTGTPKFVFGEYLTPTINTYSGSSLFSFAAVNTQPVLGSGFTGSLSNVFDYEGGDITNNSGFAVPQFFQSLMLGSNNGNGITSGTVVNRDYSAGPSTAGAGLGGTVSNASFFADVPTGSGAGTTNNYGLYLSGNGGSGGSGKTNNFAIYSKSTAKSYFAGSVVIGGTPSYAPLTVWGPDTASTSALTVVNSASSKVFSVSDNGSVNGQVLCLGATCIDEAQLKALLQEIGQ